MGPFILLGLMAGGMFMSVMSADAMESEDDARTDDLPDVELPVEELPIDVPVVDTDTDTDTPDGENRIALDVAFEDTQEYDEFGLFPSPELEDLDDGDTVVFNVDTDSFPDGNFHFITHDDVTVACEGWCETTLRSTALVWTPADVTDLNEQSIPANTRVLGTADLGTVYEQFDPTGDHPEDNVRTGEFIAPEIITNVEISSRSEIEILRGA